MTDIELSEEDRSIQFEASPSPGCDKYKEIMLSLQFSMQVEHNRLRHQLRILKDQSNKQLHYKDVQIEELQKEKDQLKQSLSSLQKEGMARDVSKEQDYLQEITQLKKQLQTQNISSENKTLSQKNELQRSRFQNSILNTDLTKTRKELLDIKNKLQQSISKQSSLARELALLKDEQRGKKREQSREIDNKIEVIQKDYKKQIAQLKQNYQTLEKEMIVCQDQKGLLENRCRLLQNKLEIKRKEEEVLKESNDFYKEKLNSTEEKLHDRQNHIQQLTHATTKLQVQIQQTEQQLKSREKIITLLEGKQQQQEEAEKLLKQAFEKISLQYDQLLLQHRTIKEEIEQHRAEVKHWEAEYLQAKHDKQQFQDLPNKIIQLQKSLERLRANEANNNQTKIQLEGYQERAQRYTNDLSLKKEQIQSLRSTIAFLEYEYKTAQEHAQTLDKQLVQAQEQLSTMSNTLCDKIKALQRESQVSKDLNQTIAQLQQQYSSKLESQLEEFQQYQNTINEEFIKLDQEYTKKLELFKRHSEQDLQDLKNIVEKAHLDNRKRSQQSASLMQQLAKLKDSEDKQLSHKLIQAQEKLAEAHRINIQLRDKLFSIENKYIERQSSCQKSVRQLQCERAAMTIELKSMRAESIQNELSIKQNMKIISQLRHEISILKKSEGELQSALQKAQIEYQEVERMLETTQEDFKKESKRVRVLKEDATYRIREYEDMREALQYEKKRNKHLEQLYVKYRNMRSPQHMQMRLSGYRSSIGNKTDKTERK